MARFVIGETTGKRINHARPIGGSQYVSRPLAMGFAVLDSEHCYRLCGEFGSDDLAGCGSGGAVIGRDKARAAAEALAARLEAECATAVAA